MFSRLATVLQELSGEEGADGDSQEVLEPRLPTGDDPASESEAPEEAMERLAHLEQLVVQLKELIRDKDSQLLQKNTELTNKDAQIKSENEASEARFTKLKLQAKAKMASLTKQINELKEHGGVATPDSSFTGAGEALEEELQELRTKLSQAEDENKNLRDALQATEQLLQDKEFAHAEQIQLLQAVVCEKDVRFQEQIQKHEVELLRVTSESHSNGELQQTLHAAQRRCEELEETVSSRSQVLEMLQQELNSADQQKQILTNQFRQMEQELAESVRLREEEKQQLAQAQAKISSLRNSLEVWEAEKAEMARLQSEVVALKDAELVSQEALQKERTEVARLEQELAQLRESEEALERSRTEMECVERELESVRQAEKESVTALEREKSEVDKLYNELIALRVQREQLQEQSTAMNEVWRHLRSLDLGESTASDEGPVCINPTLLMETVQSIEAQLLKFKEEHTNSDEKRCLELTHNIFILQEQLDKHAKDDVEASFKIQHLEQQIKEMSESGHDAKSTDADTYTGRISVLEQLLTEKDDELSALKASLPQKPGSAEATELQILVPNQTDENNTSALQDLFEETQAEDTTLVAEDTSVLSMSADNESSPELIGTQSESPEESKASSDEMVASSDSEVAHSSWTLLEAVNQEGGQEWPSVLQDFSQLQSSWETTSMEQESSTVQVESSSVIIQETVEIHVTQQTSSEEQNVSSSHVFAQVLAEELQKRYSELLAELQRLRQEAGESQKKICALKEDTDTLFVAKEAAESQASYYQQELNNVREELDNVSLQSSSKKEKQHIEMQLLEGQIAILNNQCKEKEEKIKALKTELGTALESLLEQQSQAQMLCVQLEDREQFSSELEEKLRNLESSQSNEVNNETLLKKDLEISELQQRLSEKEQIIITLNDGMSTKLLQAPEGRSLVDSEMNKLKEEMQDLKNVVDEKDTGHSPTYPDSEPVSTLQRKNEELQTQLTNTKKKLQVALVQRKDLMKKVAYLEEKVADQDVGVKKEMDKYGNKEFEEMEAKLAELQQALNTKEEFIESLEQKISQQDHVLAETLSPNRNISEEDERSQQMNETVLQSQVTSLEAECDALQRKVQEAQESRKDTLRKAKEKDRHHREQLKQQKEDYSELMGRFEKQSDDNKVLLQTLRELQMSKVQEIQSCQLPQPEVKTSEKSATNDWGQEDWVDFTAPEPVMAQQPSSDEKRPEQGQGASVQVEESVDALREEVYALQKANTELENKLADTHTILSLRDTKLMELTKDLQQLKEKEMQIDIVSEELNALTEKYQQAQSCAESLKAEMDAAVKRASAESASSIAALQVEVCDFKLFLDNKNHEIMELSQQLQEQNTLMHSLETAVSSKDELIVSLHEELKAEQEKTQRLEVEVPQKQEEEKDSETKMQQLQRKLQAALISRKEALKENKTLKDQLASTQHVLAELKEKMTATEQELEKIQPERERLISEVDRLLLENQSLGSSCESLKLVMDGILSEKNNFQQEAELAKEEATRTCREWEEKVQGMKEEYETLLKSYENVSDEAERVRRVLEAARQERQELASKVRMHEASRLEAQRQAEEAQKEVDTVKDKMRKFVKTKQQKILELEEENERLREQQEKSPNVSPDGQNLQAELEKSREELRVLQTELEETRTEGDTLRHHIEELREELGQREAKEIILSESTAPSTPAVPDEIVTDLIATKSEPLEGHNKGQEHEEISDLSKKLVIDVGAPSEEKYKLEQMENKMKEMEAALATERVQWQQLEAEFKVQLAALEHDIEDCKTREATLEQSLHHSTEREKSLIEEGVSREAQFKEILKNLETEKDNLEERLMNQLAQLNGSIASYQQEAADQRLQLEELRREVETVEQERAELESQYQSEQAHALRLEEDMRQAQRQRAEAEAQSGKRRELEQQLRSAERVKEGSQSRSRQLEELLREKQLEVRQLQKDSIQYQERISELGREAKALQISHDDVLKKQQQAQLEISKTLADFKRNEAELSDSKSQLNDAWKQLKEALADKMAIELKALEKEASLKAEAEQTLDSVRFRLGAELKAIELRLEESFREREREEDATADVREQAEAAERRAQAMQTQLDESLARLAAFSRCMSSLQDDRDRILDEARQWENRFNSALQGKEAEVREAETRVKTLTEQLQKETALKEGFQITTESLEKAEKEWQQKLEEMGNKLKASEESLEDEKSRLEQTTTALQAAQNQALSLQNKVESLHQRTRALEEGVGRLQTEVDQARAELRERETEERRLCLNLEQLEADLRSSKALTENLQMELNEKERKEVEMLGEKEQAVTQAAEEARKEAEVRAQEAEKELEQRRGELQELVDKLRNVETESNQSKTRLDSFTKAMGSLQDDRDRVLNMYKLLEEKHLQVMMDKDGLIQEAAGENNSLKEELRSLLVQRDDLYAEKAKLAAQLHGYREELNQVLSMKESQHKQLLAAQRQRIATLEKEHKEMENQLRSLSVAWDTEGHSRLEKETLSQAAQTPSQVAVAPGAEVEKLREQLEAARKQVTALEDTLLKEREAQESKSKELAELKWEGGVMRTESESAQERVAELARDLLAVEQKLLEEKEVTTQLRAENQSFAKAMASLQDSRDQALNKAQELSLKVEEFGRASSYTTQSGLASSMGSTGEVWGLKNALQALQNDRERLLEQLESQSTELKKQKSALTRLGAGELIKVSQELFEEKERNKDLLGIIAELENAVKVGKQEIDLLRVERVDIMAQAEQLKQQTLATLSERDQQLRHLTAMLDEVQNKKTQLQEEHYQRQGAEDGAPGAPQQKSSALETQAFREEVKELQRRLDQETQQRLTAEEQLQATQDRLSRQGQAKWQLALEDDPSETAVFIESPGGAVTRKRRVGPGLLRMLRVAFCSRQRTPLLLSLYLLTVHILLLLCLSGYL